MRRTILCCATVLVLVVVSVAGYLKYFGNAVISDIADPGESMPTRGEATNEGLPAQFRAAAWYDENGEIDQDGISNAIAQLNNYLAANQPTDGFGDDGTAGGILWKPRGPQNVGGRTRSLLVDFDHTRTLWAGAASGGIWKSFDRGNTWTALNNQLSNFNIGSMAIDPGNSQILYVGTGDGPYTVSLRGNGVYKSTDGGMNWANLGDTVDWAQVNSIAAARNGGNTIVLAAVGQSSDLNADGGIWRSIDGGNNWHQDLQATNASFVGFDPNDSSNAVAAACYAAPPTPGKCKAYYTENAGDATPTWSLSNFGSTATPLPSPSPYETNSAENFIEFAFSSTGGGATAIYAQHKGVYPTGSPTPSVVSKSTDGGENFATYGLGGNPLNVDNYKSVLWAGSTPDTSLLISGGLALYRSTNGGASFGTLIGYGGAIGTQPHADMMFAANDPSSSRRFYITTDGGIFRTEDIATAIAAPSPTGGWSQLNQTYQTTQFYAVAGDVSTGIITGGTQDNGSLRLVANNMNAGLLWGDDGGEAAVDGTVCFGQQWSGGLSTDGYLYRVSNCGGTPPSSPTVLASQTNISDYPGVGIAQLIIDRNSTNHEGAFFGAKAVWRTNSGVKTGTPSWYSIKDNPPISGLRPNITAMDSAPADSNYLWVGEYEGGMPPQLFRTTDALGMGFPTWTRMDNGPNDVLPHRRINDIFIDPSGAEPDDIVYVAYGGLGDDADDNLWRTTDNGVCWTDITGGNTDCGNPSQTLVGLPCVPVRTVAVQPGDPATIYAGTEIGLYVTHDGGAHWRPVMQGPSNVAISEVSFMNSTDQLLVGTYGRGIWVGKVPPGNTSTEAPNDFDGDGRSDLAVVRPTASPAGLTWHVRMTSDGYDSEAFGQPGDEVSPADYDGDGKADITVFRPAAEEWRTLRSTDSTLDTVELGTSGDVPVPADFDGDGVADPAVYRPSSGYWYAERSTEGPMSSQWGGIDGDEPVAADFDGDGMADFGIFKLKYPGLWELFYTGMNGGGTGQIQFGLAGDIPVAGDYDGDGKADIAIWRPDDDEEGNGCWYVLYSIGDYENYDAIPWGVSDDVPVPGDYDGDGKIDIAAWRPSNGTWYINESSNGYSSTIFGAEGDLPIGAKVLTASRSAQPIRGKIPSYARPQKRDVQQIDVHSD